MRAMRSAGVSQVVLAGGLRNRPHLSDLKLNLPTIRAMRYVLVALSQGDDALLRAFMRLLERYGFKWSEHTKLCQIYCRQNQPAVSHD